MWLDATPDQTVEFVSESISGVCLISVDFFKYGWPAISGSGPFQLLQDVSYRVPNRNAGYESEVIGNRLKRLEILLGQRRQLPTCLRQSPYLHRLK